ncbi:MAG: hypothetical protein COA54_02360 [Thiotrichaceae bacterium]|nr:MAG: hypothetical protein COA54_02360 [Thiotrichaceae bacterium]
MNNNIENAIQKAKDEIAKHGWRTDEYIAGNQCHLEITKDGRRFGWGMFQRLYCWTEAYEFVTKKHWINLTS